MENITVDCPTCSHKLPAEKGRVANCQCPNCKNSLIVSHIARKAFVIKHDPLCYSCRTPLNAVVPIVGTGTTTVECVQCTRSNIITCRGAIFPFGAMGYQSSDRDVHHLFSPPIQPLWRKKVFKVASFELTVFKDRAVLSKARYRGRKIRWYPFSFGWTKDRPGPFIKFHPYGYRHKRLGSLRPPSGYQDKWR